MEPDSLERIAADLHTEADLHMIHYEDGRYLATAESKRIRALAERVAALVESKAEYNDRYGAGGKPYIAGLD